MKIQEKKAFERFIWWVLRYYERIMQRCVSLTGSQHKLPLHHPAGDTEADPVAGTQHPDRSLPAGEPCKGERPAFGVPGGTAGSHEQKYHHGYSGIRLTFFSSSSVFEGQKQVGSLLYT